MRSGVLYKIITETCEEKILVFIVDDDKKMVYRVSQEVFEALFKKNNIEDVDNEGISVVFDIKKRRGDSKCCWAKNIKIL